MTALPTKIFEKWSHERMKLQQIMKHESNFGLAVVLLRSIVSNINQIASNEIIDPSIKNYLVSCNAQEIHSLSLSLTRIDLIQID